MKARNLEVAQVKALQLDELITDMSPLKDREAIVRLKGVICYNSNIRDDAEKYIQEALAFATEMKDSSLIAINMFNLGLCSNNSEIAIPRFESAASFALKSGYRDIQVASLEKLASVYLQINEFDKAQSCLDQASGLSIGDSAHNLEIEMTGYALLLAEGHIDDALQGYQSINADSLNVYGKLMKTNAIYDILLQKEEYKNALAYKDSVHFYEDSIRKLDGKKKVEEIEKNYHARIEQKAKRFTAMLWISASVVVVALVILFFILKNLKMKQRQVELMDKIADLNARIANLMSRRDCRDEQPTLSPESIVSISGLIEQKFDFAGEVFRSLPQFSLLKKLNLLHDLTPDNKAEVKIVYDALVGRFSDCCSDLRQTFTGMTNDDCLFCAMSFIGCNKEVISVAMGSSEEALRRRKSRIKQKMPEKTFRFFFSK
ncbi:MAG: hypothetical protein K2M11_04585 [Paramuribaculum sp.]|nr:hypothetical protein [Paramuribaculum sp.]